MTAAADFTMKKKDKKILHDKRVELGIPKDFVFNDIVKIS